MQFLLKAKRSALALASILPGNPMSPKRKQPVPPPDKDDDDEFDALPTPPKVVKPLFEQNCPVEIRPLKFSDKATDDKAGRPTGNFALWVNPTRKFNRKAGGGR